MKLPTYIGFRVYWYIPDVTNADALFGLIGLTVVFAFINRQSATKSTSKPNPAKKPHSTSLFGISTLNNPSFVVKSHIKPAEIIATTGGGIFNSSQENIAYPISAITALSTNLSGNVLGNA
ncbi:MAG: hypothetical protein ABGX64_06775 [Cycloclasticus sp.]